MSVLIKGMDMPKACYYCQFLWFKTSDEEGGEGMCDLLEKWVAEACNRPDWCPLVSVPPHGRLIDADALYINTIRRYDYAEDYLELIEDMPTIIEAEESDG